MAEGTPFLIKSLPGIKRDGTLFEGEHYVDGQWVRFQRGLARKIRGVNAITSTLPEIVRGLTSFSANGTQYLHAGSTSLLTQIRTTAQGAFSGSSDRTPGAYSPDANALWQFDNMNNGTGSVSTQLVAHPGSNLSDISSTTETDIYYGSADGTGALVATGFDPTSGGIMVLSPYLVAYGNGGRVDVGAAGDLTTAPDTAFVTGQKIVKGLPLRGNGSGPSGLLWSLDSVIRMTYNASILTGVPFSFDTISSESSILSSQAVIEYDGIYYWPGVDRFLQFNGVVREVENNLNINYFFDNLNFEYRQKVFAFKIPRWGEIWWCYPRGSATECTHAVIYNVRENTWYDTQLLATGLSAGIYAKVYNRPITCDLVDTTAGRTMWQNDIGVDSINGSTILPIRSYFETAEISTLVGDQPVDRALSISRMETDFVQTGNMSVQVIGRTNARAADQSSTPVTFTEEAATVDQQTLGMKQVRRLMRFRFESNVVGGDYQMGNIIGHIAPSDGRITQ